MNSTPHPDREQARLKLAARLDILGRLRNRPDWTLAKATREERTLLKLRLAAGRDLTPDDLANEKFVRAALTPPKPERLRIEREPSPCRCCCCCHAGGRS